MLRRTLALLAVLAAGHVVADDKAAPPSLEGTWKIVSGVKDGDKIPADKVGSDLVVTKDEMTMKTPEDTFKFTYALDAKAKPAAIELTITAPEAFKGSKAKGIVEVSGKTAKLSYHPSGGDRPKNFDAKTGTGEFSFVLEKK